MTTTTCRAASQNKNSENQNHYNNYYTTKSHERTRQYDYSMAIQTARMNRRFTQEKLAELIGMSEGSIKAYESGKRQPTVHILKRIADVCESWHLYADYINQDEIMSGIIPPIRTNQSKEKAAMRFMLQHRQLIKVTDDIFGIIDGGELSIEFRSSLSEFISAGFALRFAKGN